MQAARLQNSSIMPFKRSWMFVALLIPLAGLVFWRSCCSAFASTSSAFHVHGLTATLWVVLLAAQAWAIHNASPALHRRLGKLSFFLFPLCLIGGALMLQFMAQGYASKRDPFIALHGARLGTFDVIAGAGCAILWLPLLSRANIELHSPCMLVTALFLINPIIARLIPGFVPGLMIRELEDLPKFVDSVHYANLTAALIAVFVCACAASWHAISACRLVHWRAKLCIPVHRPHGVVASVVCSDLNDSGIAGHDLSSHGWDCIGHDRLVHAAATLGTCCCGINSANCR